jgi:competence protein ComEA
VPGGRRRGRGAARDPARSWTSRPRAVPRAGSPTDGSRDLFGAAWLLTALLLAWAAWPVPAPREAPCAAPRRIDTPAREGALPAVACAGAGGRALGGALPLLFGGRIDLARADAAALEVLPRVGPALAAAIVAERERAPFCALADLERVRGVGPRTRAGLAAWLEPGRDPRCARLSRAGRGP